MKRYVTLLVTVCAALTTQALVSRAHAANSGGLCSGSTTSFHMSDVHNTTTSSAWENLTDAHMTFTLASPGCAIITFSAPATATASSSGPVYSNILHVRVLLDGNSLCAPATQDDSFDPGWPDVSYPTGTHAIFITRICKNLPAGTHTLQMQYRQDPNQVSAAILGHTITVTHN